VDVCRVVGQAVSTQKDQGLTGLTLLLVQPENPDGSPAGAPTVATDTVGAGVGERVLVARGSAARQTPATRSAPTDATVVAILDSLA